MKKWLEKSIKNTLNQTYKDLAIPYFKEVFDLIDEVMVKHGIPYYLIGVSAIALELLKQGVKPARGTKDIDFAIMVSSLDQYRELVKSLEDTGFSKVDAPWSFYHGAYNVAIDLLPFGEIEEHSTIQFNERYSDLHVLGFKEILENPEEVQIEEKIANIPPLSGMVLLKLIAWSDRPEERENDLADILRIIEHYFEHNFDEIVETYNDTFTGTSEDFDRLRISAEVLGRKARFYLDKSEKLSGRIIGVVESNLREKEQSSIAKEWARSRDWEVAYAITVLESFHKGVMQHP